MVLQQQKGDSGRNIAELQKQLEHSTKTASEEAAAADAKEKETTEAIAKLKREVQDLETKAAAQNELANAWKLSELSAKNSLEDKELKLSLKEKENKELQLTLESQEERSRERISIMGQGMQQRLEELERLRTKHDTLQQKLAKSQENAKRLEQELGVVQVQGELNSFIVQLVQHTLYGTTVASEDVKKDIVHIFHEQNNAVKFAVQTLKDAGQDEVPDSPTATELLNLMAKVIIQIKKR